LLAVIQPGQLEASRPSGRELGVVALALVALTALMLFLSDGDVLFSRPFWVDEVFTLQVSDQPSPLGVLRDLSHGADGGPGLVHLSVWLVQRFVTPTPVVARTLSLVCVLCALLLTYAVLRRRFGSDASIAGALATGSHYLVVAHSYELRFYGPWLLCCAFYAWAIARHQERRTRRTGVIVAVAAVLLCTVHFYGAVTLGLMAGGIVASYGRRWRDGLRVIAPSAFAIIALLAVLPIALGIRSAYTVRSWVPEFESRQMRALVNQFWLSRALLVVVGALAVGLLVSWRRPFPRSIGGIARGAASDAGVVALASLVVMPLALALITLVAQPSMVFRYGIATTLAWAPLVALTMEFLGRWPARVSRFVFAGFWFASYVRMTFEKEVFAGDVEEARTALRVAQQDSAPIVFQSIHTIYPVWAENRTLRNSISLMEIPDSVFRRMLRTGTLIERYSRGVVIDRDMARIHRARYGFPALIPKETLDTLPRFYLVAPWQHLPLGFRSIERFVQTMFPNHVMRQLDPNLAVLERRM
jgi:hypothetical protein